MLNLHARAMFGVALALLATVASAQSQNTPATAPNQTAVQASAGSNSSKAVGVQGVSGGVPVTVTGALSLGGFQPIAGATGALSAGPISQSVALPAGTAIAISNIGSNAAFVRLTIGSDSALTTDEVIQPGTTAGFSVGSATYLDAITDGSSTNLGIQGGSGLVTGFGGSSGAASTPVTAASGSYASGALSAGAVVDLGTGGSPAANTVNARLATINTTLGSPFQTGGSIGNTTFGASQTGSWSVGLTGTLPAFGATPTFNCGTGCYQATQPVSVAALPLPTGASTSALQPALNGDGGALAHITNFPSTQPVSGTVAATQSGSWSMALLAGSQIIGAISNTAFGISGALPAYAATPTFNCGTGCYQATQPVSGTVAATESGTWTVQPGNTPNTSPWLTTLNQGGNSATVTAGNALKVDGSAVTQPVSGTFWQTTQPVSGTVTANAGTGTFAVSAASLPLPTGAATSALQTTGNTSLSTLAGTVTGSNVNVVCTSGCTGGGSGYSVLNASTYANTSSYSNVPSGGLVGTSAPTYTTGQASPLSLTTAGAIRVDGSATTQPISGTVTANAGSGTFAISASALPLPTGASTAAGLTTINTTLGSPFQAGGSIGNVSFGATQATAANLNATVIGTGTFAVQNTAATPAGANNIGVVGQAQASTTSGQYGPLMQSAVTTSVPTYTTGQTDPLSLTTTGSLRTDISTVGGVAASTGAGATGVGVQRVGVAQDTTTIAGSAPGTAGTPSSNVVSVQGVASGTVLPTTDVTSSATGSAVPAKAAYVGANSSGNLTGIIQADTSVAINVSTATTTQLVALSSGKKIYVTSFDVIAGGTGNITFEYGTGSACGTGTAVLAGAYSLAAQSGIAKGAGLGPVLVVPAGNALCVLTSAAVQMSGSVAYTQF